MNVSLHYQADTMEESKTRDKEQIQSCKASRRQLAQ